jgi:hypothetical protein
VNAGARALVVTLALTGLVLPGLHAQSTYVVVDSVRLPTQSYVGDPVELRYTIRTPATPQLPEEISQPRWGELSAFRVTPTSGGFDLRFTATPFEPGTLTIPRIDLGGVRIEGLSLIVDSLLRDENPSLRGLLGPMRLPGTRAMLLGLAFAVSFAVALAIYLLGPGRTHIRALIARRRARAPYRRLLHCVHKLQSDIHRYTMRDFYIELSRELQLFMDSRIDFNCRAATSSELIGLIDELEKSCGATPGTAKPLEEIIRAADNAKFARKTIRRKKRSRHLVVVRAVAIELENHRRRLRSKRTEASVGA